MTFKPEISIDGVAIIVTAVMAAIWIGNLQATVATLKENDRMQSESIKELSVSQNETTRQLAVVAAIVGEINHNNPSMKP